MNREGPRELFKRTFGTVLLRYVLHVLEPPREGHDRIVSYGHLRREHCLYWSCGSMPVTTESMKLSHD